MSLSRRACSARTTSPPRVPATPKKVGGHVTMTLRAALRPYIWMLVGSLSFSWMGVLAHAVGSTTVRSLNLHGNLIPSNLASLILIGGSYSFSGIGMLAPTEGRGLDWQIVAIFRSFIPLLLVGAW